MKLAKSSAAVGLLLAALSGPAHAKTLIYAGRLIEAAGLKGWRVGGVEVSTHHANFLVNRGGVGAARAADDVLVHRLAEAVDVDHRDVHRGELGRQHVDGVVVAGMQ